MRKMIVYTTALLFSWLLLWACGTTQSAAEQEQVAREIRHAVDVSTFTFDAAHAYPTGFKPVYLSSNYDVRVLPDTVKAYLPYYGRAYRAPLDPKEGGFHFTSTDFAYRVMPGNRQGNWIAEIEFMDQNRPLSFTFDIWENGTARLTVSDADRQPISFQGDIEREKERERSSAP